ncbi:MULTISPECIES: aminodeoxychorismate/anthranilate synthase component II [Lactococcus]|jgi:para-aminobenzoate synthetase component II|uniref:anthranilate synthase component II n=1 Tax=Lactococcus TaxID=1357 RepID=UPI001CDCC8DD|nr:MULTISPECIES: aminodeoxychorismate/anthranilate synthase component II [Lactococcus]MCA2389127.1 aminodeoxychorismate/anthranilate synthase component II [Lactococcus sp. NH2-7C]MCI1071035.1 aminodeoxychorismate/anthranilate synthase component II [Lactococcus lactis]MCT1182620.1 aminodeoxychorismate/anthranilate synthase component II [Lactococcus lactis]MCT1194468.1 aminodeoxychorismate/anthranilate synthase component II [Lactococcus lactis]WGV30675.1 aminodeoxychorismate/anthranilate synthas
MKLLLIDNYDSFTYLLVQYFEELNCNVTVITDKEKLSQKIRTSSDFVSKTYDAIVISPGPKTPKEAVFSREVVNLYAGKLPILGICLGQQVIAECFGGTVVLGEKPMHGKISKINHNGQGIFEGLPQDIKIARYHSLIVSHLPDDFVIDALSEDGVIQAVHQQNLKLWALQFHPESLVTEYGHEMLNNFLKQV